MRFGNWARSVSWLMFGIATSLLIYVGSNVGHQVTMQNQLSDDWNKQHGTAAVQPGQPLTLHRPRLSEGIPLAKISVASIHFTGIVLEGTSTQVLSGGPGHLIGTAYPGENDNVVISNHNSYSQQWGDLKAGDTIDLTTDYGSYSYRVTGFRVANPDDLSISASTGKPTLTFTTCYPLWAGALATQRYVVSAELVQ
jgi:sortase A